MKVGEGNSLPRNKGSIFFIPPPLKHPHTETRTLIYDDDDSNGDMISTYETGPGHVGYFSTKKKKLQNGDKNTPSLRLADGTASKPLRPDLDDVGMRTG